MGLLGTFTIALGAAVSSEVTIPRNKNQAKLLIETPVAWTAADIKFQVKLDGTNWIDVGESDGTLIKITNIPTAARFLSFTPEDSAGNDLLALTINVLPNGLQNAAKFRIVSIDTADETDENQAAERIVKVYGNSARF